ncbi:acetolactate synthase large subunit [Peribacillus sp. R9-11]|uniref:acetolactate synthase large subunit n=1 Tax=Peribacillus sp. R9-11 TaxID=3073271 RepID=UPI002868A3DE|nr:acetolactate synthase large subunit [Peribacillus sp. R9-11]WMX53278.1 acetolactate synthase large subunit [Peribacillus sp. R9-11]
MKAAELFVKCLEGQGVEYIFGVPGEENIDLLDAINKSSIQFIVCRHETGAAFIAGMMGKLTGKPGVCLSTLGPGATNMVTGVACATLDRMPLIAITAQTDLNMQFKGAHQYINILELYHPISKWSTTIYDGSVIPKIITKAFALAAKDLTGAIHIEFPNDIASALVHGEPLQTQLYDKKVRSSEQAINEVAMAINQAKFPLFLIGNNASKGGASTDILTLIEKLKAPFTETFMAKGVVPENHPLHLQTIGLPEGDIVNKAFSRADLVIAIGYDPIEYEPKKWNPLLSPIIHIDVQDHELDNYYPVKASLVGDLSANLLRLIDQIDQRNEIDPFYRNVKETILSDLLLHSTSNSYPMSPQRIIKEIREVLSNDDILLSDVGAHKLWIGRQYETLKPNTCILSNGLASMGIALPGAIGAKLACPDKKVMAVCGDGAFIMSIAEFETAVRLKVPIVIMIWRDGRYGMIEWEQKNKLGHSSNIQFNNPDFVALARSYGAKGYKVKKAAELTTVLQKAISEDGPVIVECEVDYQESFRLSERLKDSR